MQLHAVRSACIHACDRLQQSPHCCQHCLLADACACCLGARPTTFAAGCAERRRREHGKRGHCGHRRRQSQALAWLGWFAAAIHLRAARPQAVSVAWMGNGWMEQDQEAAAEAPAEPWLEWQPCIDVAERHRRLFVSTRHLPCCVSSASEHCYRPVLYRCNDVNIFSLRQQERRAGRAAEGCAAGGVPTGWPIFY